MGTRLNEETCRNKNKSGVLKCLYQIARLHTPSNQMASNAQHHFLVVSPEKAGKNLPCGIAATLIVRTGMEFAVQLANKSNALGIRERQLVPANKIFL